VRDADGKVRDYTAGAGKVETGAQIPADGQVRIGSNTKTFTATVVLQLVEEGKVDLDAPIETSLPGLVRGEGIDGNVAAMATRSRIRPGGTAGKSASRPLTRCTVMAAAVTARAPTAMRAAVDSALVCIRAPVGMSSR